MRLGNVYSGNMINDDNSVNIKSAKRGYHHGDLRAALIWAGLDLLETRVADELSLREVARAVGVSATAVYRHFPDKQSLLAALAMEGLKRLAGDQTRAVAASGGDGFAESGRAYVHFALANPGLFRLIFTTSIFAGHNVRDDPEGSAGWLLRTHVAAALGKTASNERHLVLAYRAWALVHGLAMLMLDRQIDRDEGMALLDQIVSADSVGKG